MASNVTKIARGAAAVAREVVPVVSTTKEQAHAAVLAVYKELQRGAPTWWWDFRFHDMPLPVFRLALKKQFLKNSHLTDIRVIDRKVYECKQDIFGLQYTFYNEEHIRAYLFRDTAEPKPQDFLSKFLTEKD